MKIPPIYAKESFPLQNRNIIIYSIGNLKLKCYKEKQGLFALDCDFCHYSLAYFVRIMYIVERGRIFFEFQKYRCFKEELPE
jgi:hypothetical protein